MVRFNVAVLKESLEPIIPKSAMQHLDAEFIEEHTRCYERIFRNKLGLLEKEKASDMVLIKDLLALMHTSGADFTRTFRALVDVPLTVVGGEEGGVDGEASGENGFDNNMDGGGGGHGGGVNGGNDDEGHASPSTTAAHVDGSNGDEQATNNNTNSNPAPNTTKHTKPPPLDAATEHVLQRILSDLATPSELADDLTPSIPTAQLHMLSMLGQRDPTLLQALGISTAV